MQSVDNSSYDYLAFGSYELKARKKKKKKLLWLIIQYCPSVIPSHYAFLNGTDLNCINITFERQKNI
jgi:hypothetical protein